MKHTQLWLPPMAVAALDDYRAALLDDKGKPISRVRAIGRLLGLDLPGRGHATRAAWEAIAAARAVDRRHRALDFLGENHRSVPGQKLGEPKNDDNSHGMNGLGVETTPTRPLVQIHSDGDSADE